MKISLGAAERDFLRYSVILMRILPLSVLTLHVPVPLLTGRLFCRCLTCRLHYR